MATAKTQNKPQPTKPDEASREDQTSKPKVKRYTRSESGRNALALITLAVIILIFTISRGCGKNTKELGVEAKARADRQTVVAKAAHIILDCGDTTQFRRLPSKVVGVQMTEFSVTVLPSHCWTDKLLRPEGAKTFSIEGLSSPILERVTYLDPTLPPETIADKPDIDNQLKGKVGSISFQNESRRELVSFKIRVTY